MNLALNDTTTASEICSVLEYQQASKGHTPHFIADRLNFLIGRAKLLSPREYWTWSQLMVYSRTYGSFSIRISHKQLHTDVGTSEATLRDILDRLSAKGFIKILLKNITHFGKQYVIQVGMPKSLLSVLQDELKRCRTKNPDGANLKVVKTQTETSAFAPEQNQPNENKPEITEKTSTLQTETTLTKTEHTISHSPYQDNNPSHKIDQGKNTDTTGITEEMVYLSFAEKRLTQSEAYISPIEKSTKKMLYQPRQNRAENWIPSCADFEFMGNPQAQPPKIQADRERLLDIADWIAAFELSFQQKALKDSGSGDSFGRFLMKSTDLSEKFSEHLKLFLPDVSKPFLPGLLQRLLLYKALYPNQWFPITLDMFIQHKREQQSALEKSRTEKVKPILSPEVAVSLPGYWYSQILTMVKTLRLPQTRIIEIAYHVEHHAPKKSVVTLENKRKFNFCLAIKLIKDGRWGCPKGLDIKRQQHQKKFTKP
jgi:hypothetical protein